MKLYFDFAKEGNTVILAVAAYPNHGGLKPTFKNVEVIEEVPEMYNNYHCMLKALHNGLCELEKWILENRNYEDVLILSQHKQVFEWLTKKRAGAAYQQLLNEVLEKLEYLAPAIKFSFMKVDKKTNLSNALIVQEKRKLLENPVKYDFKGNTRGILDALDKINNERDKMLGNGDNIIPFDKLKL